LTTPGECIMLPDFGAGLRRYLFENPDSTSAPSEIEGDISWQFERFLPTVRLLAVDTRLEDHFLLVKVSYSLTEFNVQDFLEIKLEN